MCLNYTFCSVLESVFPSTLRNSCSKNCPLIGEAWVRLCPHSQLKWLGINSFLGLHRSQTSPGVLEWFLLAPLEFEQGRTDIFCFLFLYLLNPPSCTAALLFSSFTFQFWDCSFHPFSSCYHTDYLLKKVTGLRGSFGSNLWQVLLKVKKACGQ